MSNKKLATFRIDEEKWLAFQDKAKADGSNASSVLMLFVSGYLDGSIDINLDHPVKSISLERRIEEYLANNLEKYLEKHLDIKLDAQVSNAVSTAVPKALDQRQEQLNQTIEAKLEPLTGRLETFDSRLGELSCRLDLLEEQTIRSGTTPPENELQGTEAPTDDQLTQGVSKAALEPIFDEVKEEREAKETGEQEQGKRI